MRILHIVTLQTPGNAFGGPTRVALNLARGQLAVGHDVRLLALGDGYDGAMPERVDGVPVVLLRARHVIPRFEVSGVTSEQLLTRAVRAVRGADVVHVHLMRDLVTLPAALLALVLRRPVVVQGHGMLDVGRNRVARAVDLALRPVLRRASAVCHLTDAEREDLMETARGRLAPTVHLPNGVPNHDRRRMPETPRVVFLARFQTRKHPEVFVRAAARIHRTRPDVRFVMAGPDSGERSGAARLSVELGLGETLEVTGALEHDEAVRLLQSASVYVLPSVDEPFPLSVLEAMSVGVPVVITSTNGLAPDVRTTGAGAVADDVEAIAAAVLGLLEAEANDRASRAAHDLIGTTYSIGAIVDRLDKTYAEVAAGSR